jgi:hypothetical protein
MRWKVLTGAGAVVVCAGLAPPTRAELLYGVSSQGTLFRFDSAQPSRIQSAVPIIGLQPNELVVGLDYRAVDENLYAMGSFGNTYILHKDLGTASLAGNFAGINGTNFGYDWNPAEDNFRLIGDTGSNFRLTSSGLFSAWDTSIAFDGSDVNAGVAPNVVDTAYANNVREATSTLLYGICALTDSLVRIDPPSGGVADTVGPLGIEINARGGFDISGATGIAYLGAMLEGQSIARIYSVNLATGATTDLGQIDGGLELRALTVVPSVPSPGAAALAFASLCLFRKRRR